MRTLQEILDEYKTLSQGLSFRELAIYERDVWLEVRSTQETHGQGLEHWFTKVVGAKNRDVRLRSALLGHDEAASELWKRIDAKDLSPSSALAVLRTALLSSANQGTSMKDAVTQALARYDKLPFVSRSKDGYLFRRPHAKVRKKKKEKRVYVPKMSPQVQASHSAFWDSIKEQTEAYLTSALPHTDPVFISSLRVDLVVMLKVVAQDFRRAVVKALARDLHAATMEPFEGVSHEKMEEACLVLKLVPPEFGTPVDMNLAKSRKRSLVHEYHPDKTQGATGDAFMQVMDSYDVLEEYNSQCKKDGQNGDSSVKERG